MYTNENGLIYSSYTTNAGSSIKEFYGMENTTISTDTEIISYTFDLSQGLYVETGRTTK